MIKKGFQSFLLTLGLLFLYLWLYIIWELFQEAPTNEEVIKGCEKDVRLGYGNWSSIGDCWETHVRMIGLGPLVGAILIFLFAILAWINLHFGLKLFKKMSAVNKLLPVLLFIISFLAVYFS
jgi:hypothetical protein